MIQTRRREKRTGSSGDSSLRIASSGNAGASAARITSFAALSAAVTGDWSGLASTGMSGLP